MTDEINKESLKEMLLSYKSIQDKSQDNLTVILRTNTITIALTNECIRISDNIMAFCVGYNDISHIDLYTFGVMIEINGTSLMSFDI